MVGASAGYVVSASARYVVSASARYVVSASARYVVSASVRYVVSASARYVVGASAGYTWRLHRVDINYYLLIWCLGRSCVLLCIPRYRNDLSLYDRCLERVYMICLYGTILVTECSIVWD